MNEHDHHPFRKTLIGKVEVHVHLLDGADNSAEDLDSVAVLKHAAHNTDHIHTANVEMVSTAHPSGAVVLGNGEALESKTSTFLKLSYGPDPRTYRYHVRRGKVKDNDANVNVSTMAVVHRERADQAKPGIAKGVALRRELVCDLSIRPRLVLLVLPADITAANPPLALDRESRIIKECLARGTCSGSIDCYTESAVRASQVRKYLLKYRPGLVHFCGHGRASGEIQLTDDFDKPVALPQSVLADLFSIVRDTTRCVLLNCCFSKNQAEEIIRYVDCAIGISGKIGDSVALAFAEGFYEALALDVPVQTAFDSGRNAAMQRNGGNALSPEPELLCREGVDPSEFRLLGLS